MPTNLKFLVFCLAVVASFNIASLNSCSHNIPSPQDRQILAEQLVLKANWRKEIINTDQFLIISYLPEQFMQSDLLSIYIEGDGLAWASKTKLSSNPTPIRPIGLELALKHNGNAAYLARPCQFLDSNAMKSCHSRYWSSARFSSEVIEANQQAINQLKESFSAKEIQLIGYSGGAAIASIIAAQRNDVIKLITIAGNLDHITWTKEQGISPLKASLNPIDFWQGLENTPQLHLVGANDRVISNNISAVFSSYFPTDKKPTIRIIEGFDHRCCWIKHWPVLLLNADNSKN